jgi:uncharacterized protein YoxC
MLEDSATTIGVLVGAFVVAMKIVEKFADYGLSRWNGRGKKNLQDPAEMGEVLAELGKQVAEISKQLASSSRHQEKTVKQMGNLAQAIKDLANEMRLVRDRIEREVTQSLKELEGVVAQDLKEVKDLILRDH